MKFLGPLLVIALLAIASPALASNRGGLGAPTSDNPRPVYEVNYRHGGPAIVGRAAWRASARVYAWGARALNYGGFGRGQCVDLVRRVANIPQGVREWRRGIRATDVRLPVGTPVATFLNRNGTPSDRYDGGVGVGAPGNNTTHAAIVAGYDERGNLKLLEQWVGSGGPRLAIYRQGDPRGGEKDARNYFSINGVNGRPLGYRNPLAKFIGT